MSFIILKMFKRQHQGIEYIYICFVLFCFVLAPEEPSACSRKILSPPASPPEDSRRGAAVPPCHTPKGVQRVAFFHTLHFVSHPICSQVAEETEPGKAKPTAGAGAGAALRECSWDASSSSSSHGLHSPLSLLVGAEGIKVGLCVKAHLQGPVLHHLGFRRLHV